MFKMIVFYQKPSDVEAFLTRYKNGHIQTLQALPGMTSFSLNIVDKSIIGEAPVWAYAEVCFPTLEAMKAAMKSPEMMMCGQDAMQFAASIMTVTTGHEEALS
ncbi:MAG: EthD family reductase [bacterium]|nr:EthD family reductase [bacterium]